MNRLILILTIALTLSFCHLTHASSIELENDLKKGELYAEALRFESEMERGNKLKNLQDKINKATANIIKTTAGELRKKGHVDYADFIEMQWRDRYQGFIYKFNSRDIGDHEALEWLLSIHNNVEFIIGEKICKATRIHDLWVIAMTVKVVFSCVDNVDPLEYTKHFIPLSGVASYWVSYGVCCGASMGSGFFFLCGLVGMGVEELVTRFVAPPLSLPCWKLACGK